MAKYKPLTDEQKSFVRDNKGKMTMRKIAEHLSLSYYKVQAFASYEKHKEKMKLGKGIFNVNDQKNWLADDGKPPKQSYADTHKFINS